MLEHFAECIKMSKGSRQEAIQINVYTALLMALKTLAEMKLSLGQDSVKTVATEMIMVGVFGLKLFLQFIECKHDLQIIIRYQSITLQDLEISTLCCDPLSILKKHSIPKSNNCVINTRIFTVRESNPGP